MSREDFAHVVRRNVVSRIIFGICNVTLACIDSDLNSNIFKLEHVCRSQSNEVANVLL